MRLLTVWAMPLALCLLVGLCSACSDSGVTSNGSSPASSKTTQNFSIVNQPKVVVKASFANVSIHTGNDHTVVTTVTKRAATQSKLDALQVTTGQQGDTVTINAQPLNDPKNEFISLDITTAPTANVSVQIANGNIDVNGVQGDMELDVSNYGQITASNIKGVVSSHLYNGNITFKQADLSGKSQLQTNSGPIRFTGTLNPQGNYQFQTYVGPIDVTLPASAAFHLSASTDSGVVTNDFKSVDVGQTPRATLTLLSKNGLIDIHKA